LAQVLGIVKQHGGHITVQSQLGQGTTFTVFLPLLLPESMPEEVAGPVAVSRGQEETILLVEDEPTVQAALYKMLRQLGYQVLAASDGYAALKVFAQHHEDINLVLVDMVMPGMDGSTLLSALKNQSPGVKVIFMSGYPLDEGRQFLDQGLVDWFQKPISLQNLSRILSNGLRKT
jgi:CheY-like chemotaxis protein